MDHLTLANQFNSFAYELVNNHSKINKDITSVQDDTLLRRIVFSRYYYALYHKYLAHDKDLSSKSGPGLHETILTKVASCGDPKLYQVYLKLRNLRIWADYQDNNKIALSVNLMTINADVYSVIKREKIS
ncbi:MAG: hypothetical protein L3J19_05680 [Sulfurimonas sp.]|nr:hypothetical protein [Sulfurimonas sp.]